MKIKTKLIFFTMLIPAITLGLTPQSFATPAFGPYAPATSQQTDALTDIRQEFRTGFMPTTEQLKLDATWSCEYISANTEDIFHIDGETVTNTAKSTKSGSSTSSVDLTVTKTSNSTRNETPANLGNSTPSPKIPLAFSLVKDPGNYIGTEPLIEVSSSSRADRHYVMSLFLPDDESAPKTNRKYEKTLATVFAVYPTVIRINQNKLIMELVVSSILSPESEKYYPHRAISMSLHSTVGYFSCQ